MIYSASSSISSALRGERSVGSMAAGPSRSSILLVLALGLTLFVSVFRSEQVFRSSLDDRLLKTPSPIQEVPVSAASASTSGSTSARITIEYEGSSVSLPTCGCPATCDAVALLFKRSQQHTTCLEAIAAIRRSHSDLSETEACTLAAADELQGACGVECHPFKCHTSVVPVNTKKIPANRIPANKTLPSRPLSSSLRSSSTSALPKASAVLPKLSEIQLTANLQSLDWSQVKNKDTPRKPFVRHDKVVIATKVRGPENLGQLQQMLCLFTAAYNRHVNYDIVIFTTLPWEEELVKQVQAVVPQTKIFVELEGPPLEEQVAAMSQEERRVLYERCQVEPGQNITWDHRCAEVGRGNNTKGALSAQLGYAWQSEFRAYHIWKMPVLAPYKYMIWMDTDALCSKPWFKDPMQMMVENDLVLMFDNFPSGATRNPLLIEKMKRAYNRTICYLKLDAKNGHFMRMPECRADANSIAIPQVHGFHHITNLDFFRSEKNINFLKILVESHRFSREWDDQLAITVPPAMEAPEKAWDYRRHGLDMGIFHNGMLDGRGRKVGKYTEYWEETIKNRWESARDMCTNLVRYNGR